LSIQSKEMVNRAMAAANIQFIGMGDGLRNVGFR